MSSYAESITGYGFIVWPKNDDDESDVNVPTSGNIIVEPCGNLVIGPIGHFVVLEDTYLKTFGEDDDLIKLRDITNEEKAALLKVAEDNGIENPTIGWTVTGYYG